MHTCRQVGGYSCVSLSVWVCVCLFGCVCVWKWERHCRCWSFIAYQKQLFHPQLYLSHAQKVLPQKVAVPHPHLRFPWRYLHPQVGITLMPPSSLAPECFALFAGHTHITCSFGVCHHNFIFFNSPCEAWNCTVLVEVWSLSTQCSHKKLVYLQQTTPLTVHTSTCLHCSRCTCLDSWSCY